MTVKTNREERREEEMFAKSPSRLSPSLSLSFSSLSLFLGQGMY